MQKDNGVDALLENAKNKIAEDMAARDCGAIIWSIPAAGFHFIPEIDLYPQRKGDKQGVRRFVERITGLYLYKGRLYAIEEEQAGVSVDQFYRPGIDVPPVVVTLSADKAKEVFGDPTEKSGFTTTGSLEEWTVVADCYFEALAEA
ncbi:MAG: hypothetical protein NC204_02325 [Candidatus Amulumruptor caecigallinarius]|nr:hypothetical protein [Candidatus Amulumruptor caecigallinarius]